MASGSESTPSMPLNGTTVPIDSPHYIAGDIVRGAKADPATGWLITRYDPKTDTYERAFIYQNEDQSWGHRIDTRKEKISRAILEKVNTVKITHVDPSQVQLRLQRSAPLPDTTDEVTTTTTTSGTLIATVTPVTATPTQTSTVTPTPPSYRCNPNRKFSPSELAAFVPDMYGFSMDRSLLPAGTTPALKSGVIALYYGEGVNSGRMLGVVINDYGCSGFPKGGNSGWDSMVSLYRSNSIAGFPSTLQDIPDDNRTLQAVNIHDRIMVVFSAIGQNNRFQDIEKLNGAFNFRYLASQIE